MSSHSFQIRNIRIAPATVLAPMAGVTDTVFRRMIRGLGGCGLIMTEFTSAEGVTRNAARTLHYLYFEPDEHPITAQLFGANAEALADAARARRGLGLRHRGHQSGLPGEKSGEVRRLGPAARSAANWSAFCARCAPRCSIPLTIKIRAGWDEKSIVAVEVARMAEVGRRGGHRRASAHARSRDIRAARIGTSFAP